MVPLVGAIVTDRHGVNKWRIVKIERQYAWIHTEPTPPNEVAIPIPLSMAGKMRVVDHFDEAFERVFKDR